MTRFIFMLFLTLLISFPAYADKAEDKAEIEAMRLQTLQRLYKEEPGAKDAISHSVGYAVFSSGGVNIVFLSAGYGSGVAIHNGTGKQTYMEMATGGVGLGLGIKDYRLVFIFSTEKAFNQFIEHGWDLSGQADAAAKTSSDGGELSGALDVMPGVTLYQLTEAGLALQATIQGTKYWADDDLNY